MTKKPKTVNIPKLEYKPQTIDIIPNNYQEFFLY